MGTVLTCPECGVDFRPRPKANSVVYCGAACRLASYVPPEHLEESATEYEVPKEVMREAERFLSRVWWYYD